MRNNWNLPPNEKLRPMKNNPPMLSIKPLAPCHCRLIDKPKPYLESFKQLRPKIHQPKNYPISITRSTFDPLKASSITTQSPETQLNMIDSGARKKMAVKREMENNDKKSGKWEIELENWRWHRWGGVGDGWCWRRENWLWVVPKRVELVLGEREGLVVDWVVDRTKKAWDEKERQCIGT